MLLLNGTTFAELRADDLRRDAAAAHRVHQLLARGPSSDQQPAADRPAAPARWSNAVRLAGRTGVTPDVA